MIAKIRLISIVILLLAGLSAAPAQRVDPNYPPAAEKDTLLDGGTFLPLADGKLFAILTYDRTSGGSGTRVLVRITADGVIDPSFNCTACNFTLVTMAAQPDGKYLVGGHNGDLAPRLVRLNTDGSVDPTFPYPFPGVAESWEVQVYAVTPAGQIYVALRAGANTSLYRLNSNGSIDNTFTPVVFPQQVPANSIRKIMLQPDGKLLVLGFHPTYGRLFRINTDGTKDTGWNSPVLTPGSHQFASTWITAAALQADGKVVFAGQFVSVNGVGRFNNARLNPDSSLDGGFMSGVQWGTYPIPELFTQSDGKLVLYISNSEFSSLGFRRLNADLTIDNSYVSPSTQIAFDGMPPAMALTSNDQMMYIEGRKMKRLNTNGSADNAFAFELPTASSVTTMALQSDGKMVVAGSFRYLNRVIQPTIGRLNADGTRDASFVTGTGFDVAPSKVAEQPGGKILVYGSFFSYNGQAAGGLIRLNSDGSRDGAFGVNLSGVKTFDVQADGKMVLFGGNIDVNGSSRTGVARLNADGTLDTAFNPLVGAPNIAAGFVQTDGKILIAGALTSVNGVPRANIARLNGDGSLDASFDAGNISTIAAAAVHLDGRYVVAVDSEMVRLNTNGTLDPSYHAYNLTGLNVLAIVVEANGATLIGGSSFDNYGMISRIRPNGTWDEYFRPNPNRSVRAFVKRPDNKIIAGGDFSVIGEVLRASIAKFLVSGTPYDFDGDGRADPSVTRPSDFWWYQLTGPSYNFTAFQLGQVGDKVVPGDYDGDGKTDLAIWRPSLGNWAYRSSVTGALFAQHNGDAGDIPVPSDTDGDGRTDMVVVTPGYVWKGIAAANGQIIVLHQFGQAGDKPVVGDFDGDRKFDIAVYRPSEGKWLYNRSSSGASLIVGTVHWGLAEDTPVPADYDGDGTTDFAVFRPSEGNWYVLNSSGGYTMLHFGATGDKPIPADYDGDGKADIAVYRPSEGFWYELLSTGGYTGYPWGIASDIPTPNAYIPPNAPPRTMPVTTKQAVKRK